MKMIQLIITILALTVMAPGHAETNRDLECLANNIFYEAGNESEEGKAAVGIVTLNRAHDSRFGKDICQVVNQRTVKVTSREVTKTEMVPAGIFGVRKQQVTKTVTTQVATCQFSWVCETRKKLKRAGTRWEESMRIAKALLDGDYLDLAEKYSGAMYFHSIRIRPSWAHQKQLVSRIGGHVFYSD